MIIRSGLARGCVRPPVITLIRLGASTESTTRKKATGRSLLCNAKRHVDGDDFLISMISMLSVKNCIHLWL